MLMNHAPSDSAAQTAGSDFGGRAHPRDGAVERQTPRAGRPVGTAWTGAAAD